MNDKAIKVLLIEDNPGDTRLIREMLKEAGATQLELVCTDRLSTGLERLAEGDIDVILLDLGLPDSQGLDTLGRVLAEPPGAPVIVVLTGLDDEALAIQAVRAGAQDYLVKGQVDGNLLARAMHYAIERQRAEEELRESEERYRTLFERTANPILVIDTEENYIDCNEAALQFVECPRDELLVKNIRDFIPTGKERQVLEEHGPLWKSGGTVETEYYVHGKAKILELTITPAMWQDQRVVFGIGKDVTERKRAEEKLQRTLEKLREALGGIIQTVASTVEMKDPYTAGHQRRVANLARAIATEMGLSPEQIEGIRMAGGIHDLGKVGVPAEILGRPGQLSDLQFGLIKMHCQIGYDVLKTIEFPWPVAQIVLQHHERLDGSGYPQGLSGEEILLEARILAVADVVEAMASRRPYRPPRGLDKALEEISQNRGVLYDPEAVDACLKLFTEKGFTFE